MARAWSQWLSRQPRLLERLTAFNDWHYEVLGILGLSLATNILAGILHTPSSGSGSAWVLMVSVAVSGACALRCGFYVRREYEVYWRLLSSAEAPSDRTFREHLRDRFSDEDFFGRALAILALSGALAILVGGWRMSYGVSWPQPAVILEILAEASQHFIVAVGFMLVFATARFFPLSQAAFVAAGAYLASWLHQDLGLTFLAAVLVALVACGVLGWCSDYLVFRTLRRKQASALVLLVASLGLYAALQNTISLVFGDATISLLPAGSIPVVKAGTFRVGGIHVLSILAGLGILASTYILYRSGSIGQILRAVALDSDLAETKGISSSRVVGACFMVGSVLVASGGLLVAVDEDLTPTMGLPILLMGIVAALVFQRLNPLAVAAGSIVLSVLLALGENSLGAEWRNTVAFGALIAVCAFRARSSRRLETLG